MVQNMIKNIAEEAVDILSEALKTEIILKKSEANPGDGDTASTFRISVPDPVLGIPLQALSEAANSSSKTA